MSVWRVGRQLRRTLYRDEQCVGMVDTPEIAAEIVETMNRVGQLLDEVRAPVIGRQVCGACLNVVDVLATRRLDFHHDNSGTLCAGSERVAETPVQAVEPGHLDAQRRSEATPQKDLLHSYCNRVNENGVRTPMANTVEMLRLMRHAADLLDACDPAENGARLSYQLGGAGGREAVERATAEAVAMGMASMVLRMVAAALEDEAVPDAG